MHKKTLILLALFLSVSGGVLWERWPTTQNLVLAASPLSPQATPIQIKADWPTFTHPTWGMSFRYPPEWTATIPDFESMGQIPEGESKNGIYDSPLTNEEIEYAKTLGHLISLRPQVDEGWGNVKIEIVLSNYTLSPQGDLENWVTLSNEVMESRPSALELSPLGEEYRPATADDALYAIHVDENVRIDSIWLSRRGLVYSIHIYGAEPRVVQLAKQISASLKFDTLQQIRLRESGLFAGDEEALRQLSERMAPSDAPPSPLSPLLTAAQPPTATPTTMPNIAPTPTATVFVALTEPQRYEGDPPLAGMPAFEVWYDAALWELTEGKTGMNYLVHHTIENCTMDLVGTITEAQLSASSTSFGYSWSSTSAGYNWSIHQLDLNSYNYGATHPNWEMGVYRFNITYPDPLLDGRQFFEIISKSECGQQVEAILNTFTLLDEGMIWPIPTTRDR